MSSVISTAETARHPGALTLLWLQVCYQHRIFWRTPVAAFFTLGLPLILMVIFNALFGGAGLPGSGATRSQFYVPALAVFGAANACYTYLAVATAFQRDAGVLKRLRGTPLPPWIYIAGCIVSSVWLGLVGVAAMLTLGALAYDLTIAWRAVPAAAVSLILGMTSFAALGMMVAALVRRGETAQAVANATLITLAFISNVFIPPSELTAGWIAQVADLFPLKHFAAAFAAAFDPRFDGHGFRWTAEVGALAVLKHLAVLLGWGAAATFIASKYFRWQSI